MSCNLFFVSFWLLSFAFRYYFIASPQYVLFNQDYVTEFIPLEITVLHLLQFYVKWMIHTLQVYAIPSCLKQSCKWRRSTYIHLLLCAETVAALDHQKNKLNGFVKGYVNFQMFPLLVVNKANVCNHIGSHIKVLNIWYCKIKLDFWYT